MKLSMLCWLCLPLSTLAAPEDLPFEHLDTPLVKSWKAMRDAGYFQSGA